MASADVHPQTGFGEPSAAPKLSKAQKRKEKRASKNAKGRGTIGDVNTEEEFERAYRKAQHTDSTLR